MQIKTAQFIGLNTDQKAAQVISTLRDLDNVFFGLLILSSDDAFTKGRQALSELSDFYFEAEGPAAQKLKVTFEEASRKFPPESEFHLVLGSLSGKVLYLISKGEVEVYLKREGRLSALLSLGTPSQLISGFLEEGDKIFFTTKSLTSILGEDLSKTLDVSVDAFDMEITSKVGASEEGGGLAGLFIGIEREKEEAIPAVSNGEEVTTESYQQQDYRPSRKSVVEKVALVIGTIILKILGSFPKSGRGRLILALTLILIIGIGAGLKYKNTKDAQNEAQFNILLQEAKDEFSTAKGLAALNPKEAKERLDASKDKVTQALKIKSKNQEALDLQKQIEGESSTILQQFTASDFPVFLDLDLVKKDFKAEKMSLSDGNLLILDPNTKTLITLSLSKKSNEILAGSEQLGEGKFASLNGALAFVYSQDKGILKVDIGSKKVTEVSEKDEDLKEVLDIYGFAGNVYLLDLGNNKIWKYLPTSEGYSDKREYLTAGTEVDFSNSIRMQIESSIYVLKSSGEILRFTRGNKDNFILSGLPSEVKSPKSFFVSSETDNLYLLDSGNSRILILTKTGEYKGEISGEKFATATDLVVDETGKKVYLLEGSKIYQVDLK